MTTPPVGRVPATGEDHRNRAGPGRRRYVSKRDHQIWEMLTSIIRGELRVIVEHLPLTSAISINGSVEQVRYICLRGGHKFHRVVFLYQETKPVSVGELCVW